VNKKLIGSVLNVAAVLQIGGQIINQIGIVFFIIQSELLNFRVTDAFQTGGIA
jgi:hypothetical protein